MSKHLINNMVYEVMNSTGETKEKYERFAKMSFNDRKRNPEIFETVRNLKIKWLNSGKIQLLATLGWIEYESVMIFCYLLEEYDKLREEYEEMRRTQKLIPYTNEYFDEYMKINR